MLTDIAHCGGANPLEGDLRFLNAEDEEGDGTGVNDVLGELGGVLGDVADCPGGGLLYGGVELLKAGDEGVQGAAVYDGLGEVC